MKKLHSKGFGAIEALLIVVIIGVIGGVGYYVYNSQKKTNTTLDNAAKSQGEPQKADKKTSDNSTADKTQTDPNSGYFVIKDWGVRIKTSDSSDNLYYKADTYPNMIDIYSKRADVLSAPGGTACKGEYIAFLSRYPVADTSQNDAQNTGPFTKIKDVNGYTYWVTTHKEYGPSCYYASDGMTLDQSVADKFNTIAQSFRTDSYSIEEAQ